MDANNNELEGVKITTDGNYISIEINNEDGIIVKVNLVAL